VKAAEEEKLRVEQEKKRAEDQARQKVEEAERKAREQEEAMRQRERRAVLRKENLEPKVPDRNFFKALNSKANKCAVFPKKLSSLTRDNFSSILKEFDTLNLSRYVAELVTHIVEAPIKNADAFAMAEMCSAIHQRYFPEFGEALIPALVAQFESCDPSKIAAGTNADAELIATVTKRRAALRLLSELFICGLDQNLLTVLQTCISELIKKDPLRKSGTVYNMMMLLSFVRCAGPSLGIVGDGADIIVDSTKAKRFQTVFEKYFEGVCEYLTEEYKKMKRSERFNKEQLRKVGVISDKSKEQYEEHRAVFEKLLQNVQQFAEALGKEMPKLVEDKIDSIEEIGTEVVSTQTQLTEQEVNSLWPDEEIRSFYEDLPDLSGKVPAVLLGLGGPKVVAAAADAIAVAVSSSDAPSSSPSCSEPVPLSAADEAELEAAGKEEDTNAPKPKTPLEVFMVSLNECFSRRKADDMAEEFAFKFGEKKGRNRLLEVLFSCPRNKLELIPRFCRIAATLTQYPMFEELAPALCKKLESQFFYLLKQKNQLTLEGKLRNIRFVGELVNFRLFPVDTVFHLFGKLLDEFVHHNVEVGVTLLEVCGRFLYRSPATHVRMRVALERMMRIKDSKSLDERLTTAVDNAFFHCNPPDTPSIVRKIRSPLQQFVRFLVFRDLDNKLRAQTLEHLRRLPWKQNDTEEYVVKCFLKLSRGKFSTIPHLAWLIAQLAPHHVVFSIKVIDGLLESTRLCLEDRRGGEPQLQIMNMRFLGELFLVQMVDARLMFDVLYTTLFLGVTDPNKTEDPFRVRLVCTLLDLCAKALAVGSGAKRVEIFVQYFQRYVLALKFLPLDLHFALNDTLERLPVRAPKFRSLAEAAQAIRKLEGAPEVDAEQMRKERERQKQEMEEQMSDEAKRIVEEEKRLVQIEERRKRAEELRRQQEEEKKEFDRELALMQSDVSSSRSGSTGKGLKMGIPVALLQQKQQKQRVVEFTEDGEIAKEGIIPFFVWLFLSFFVLLDEEDNNSNNNNKNDDENDDDDDMDSDEGEDSVDEEEAIQRPKEPEVAPFKGVTFKVLLRKGAKVQARDLSIPEDSVLATKV
jgi:regulator of nonsense transcripts 2